MMTRPPVVREIDMTAHLALSSDACADPALTDFGHFIRRNRGIFLKISLRHRAMGILDDEDIEQEAFLAWEECRKTYDPSRHASFLRFVVSKVEVALHERYRILRRGGLSYREDNGGEDGFFHDSAIAHCSASTGYEDQTPISPEDDLLEEPLDPPVVDLLSNRSIHCFTHTPLYQHPHYRAVFQSAMRQGGYSPADGAFTAGLAERCRLTRRRISQIFHEMLDHLSRPSLRRDRDMLEKHHDTPVQLHHEHMDRFYLCDREDPDRVQHIVRSMLSLQVFCSPIIVDQYYRVLDGVQRVYAAKRLRYEYLPIIIHTLPDSHNVPDDSRFLDARNLYTAGSQQPRAPRLRKPSRCSSAPSPLLEYLS